MAHDHKRGVIRHSAEAALVTSPLFRQRVVKAKVGKASYKRNNKHRNKGLESGQKQAA
ncbi:alternative ribosome rescue factor ArfA [Allohahella marinimesophila]|uniref:Alternative ribosome-rescue factor A n=1 Tax=Allohahella marinimesophila TaxID=1054972 RepID=A0ABP7NST0_9GAMM